MELKVIKRNGNKVNFELGKIEKAITKAFDNSNVFYTKEIIARLGLKVFANITENLESDEIDIEYIQDQVEKTLTENGFYKVSKNYILYRKNREVTRERKSTVIDYKDKINEYIKAEDWRCKENSTVSTSLGGLILSNSGIMTASYWLSEIYDEEIANAHKKADIHIHDLSMLSGYCAGWSLKQLIKEGLGGVSGRITSSPASHLSTLCNQMVNFLGIMQNEWAGAQAFSSFDTYLAPFVKTDNLKYKDVKQCIQSFVYGVNTPSRWGCVDTDTEILSVNGFKKYDELKEGDLIYTWNNGNLEVNKVNKVISKPFKGKLHSYKSKNYNQTVTPNHRVLVKKFNKNEYEIKHSDEIFDVKTTYSLPTKFKSTNLKGIDLTNDEIILSAILLTDGNIDFRKDSIHKVSIFKSNNRYGNDLIIETLNNLNIKYSVSEREGFSKVNVYSIYGEDAKTICALIDNTRKDIDKKFLEMNQEQADLFLKVWSSFDGSSKKFKCQYDNEIIGDKLQQIALLAGYTSYHTKKNKTNYIKIRLVDNIIPTERTEVEYDGIVWCPNVDNGTAVFRKDGNVFISGQTQAPFTNITLDWVVPNDLAELQALVGGKEMSFKYKDCQKEMDMVNKAFLEVMIEGDANGRGFQYPIPTYSITKNFDWSETENNKLLFEMTAKYGTPYFSNYINSDMEPSDVRSMCCRLRLDLRELRKKSGGFFGSGESTGSVGVVTINMPRIAFLAKDEKDFYNRLDKIMDLSARSLKVKRDIIAKLLEEGLYPYTKRYLGSFNNHFSTIGLVGMNEAGLNACWVNKDMTSKETQEFSKDVLNHMRNRLSDYQELYGDLYNLEATPAESTSYRLAKHDKKLYPHIITSGTEDNPYYTNSTHLPVSFTEDIFEALDIQDGLQTLYTSGTVFHAFLGEKLPNWQSASKLVKIIAENYKLPYYTMSPTYSVCSEHGYLSGEQWKCPHCGKETEVYSRITGYYRPIKNWNAGKSQEFRERKEYEVEKEKNKEIFDKIPESDCSNTNDIVPAKMVLITTSTCPNCIIAEKLMDSKKIKYEIEVADKNPDLALKFKISNAPTLLILNNKDELVEKITNASNISNYFSKK